MAARKHRATGQRPPGGSRPGAGRKPGSNDVLPRGAVEAVKAVRLRIPDGTPQEAEDIANRALQRVVDVMDGKVHYGARDVLTAAAMVRNEVCGPIEQRVKTHHDVNIRVVDPYAEPKE